MLMQIKPSSVYMANLVAVNRARDARRRFYIMSKRKSIDARTVTSPRNSVRNLHVVFDGGLWDAQAHVVWLVASDVEMGR
jgi:hypothetical protein